MSKNIIFLCRALPRLSQLASADKVPVTLVGFSKGCAVLNQVLCDIRTAFSDIGDSNLHLREFAKNSLERMVWLDGGHNGEEVTWITDRETLKTVVEETPIKFDVRVTPYQVRWQNLLLIKILQLKK